MLPVGKLPPELLAKILSRAPILDGRVVFGPGVGMDCAVVDPGIPGSSQLLVFKSDPITFASQEIGWYAVQVNANDIATCGATPRWLLATLLLPESGTGAAQVEAIFEQLSSACRSLGISLIGGHTEITHGLTQPVLAGTMVGEVERERLVTPRGLRPGDRLLLTKCVPIEAVALLARELAPRLVPALTEAELEQARSYLYQPGISVLADARLALQAGQVSAMHDPTEGGFYTAVWELAQAGGCTLVVDPRLVPVPELAQRVCALLGIDPLGAISSGALLLATPPADARKILAGLQVAGIPCTDVGWAEAGPAAAWQELDGERTPLPYPQRDEIARL